VRCICHLQLNADIVVGVGSSRAAAPYARVVGGADKSCRRRRARRVDCRPCGVLLSDGGDVCAVPSRTTTRGSARLLSPLAGSPLWLCLV